MTSRSTYILSTLMNLILFLFLFISYCSAAPTSTHILEKRKGGGGGGRGSKRSGVIAGVAMAGLVGVGICCYLFVCCSRCLPCCGGRKKTAAAEARVVPEDEAKLDTPESRGGDDATLESRKSSDK
ncbi:hypothetical protein DFP73DRAFT_547241 [Morchella snyderi]|nr:hypothetical protein DFP73DRAFT_547241 [Morchella snyderi]